MATQTVPLTKLPYVVDSPDGINGQISTWRQARYISIYIQGPAGYVYVGGTQRFSTRETYSGFRQQASIGTDVLEKILGTREITGSLDRYQPRGLGFKRLLRQAYHIPSDPALPDSRLDVLPVTLFLSYVLVGPNLNYDKPIDQMSLTYSEVTFDDYGQDYAVGDAVRETLTFRGQAERFVEGDITIATSTPISNTFAKNK